MSSMRRSALLPLVAAAVLLFGGCASVERAETLNVNIAGVEPLKGEGLEVRMLVKLRIQNASDAALEYNGVSVQMDVQGKRFATGVSNASGSIPRFGEAVVAVPVSVSLVGIVRQVFSVINNETRGKLAYEMTGQLAGPVLGSARFQSAGELTLPAEIADNGK
jgi:hypothetical protein